MLHLAKFSDHLKREKLVFGGLREDLVTCRLHCFGMSVKIGGEPLGAQITNQSPPHLFQLGSHLLDRFHFIPFLAIKASVPDEVLITYALL
jgi:hypothetical protein